METAPSRRACPLVICQLEKQGHLSTCCSKRLRESAPGLIVSNHRYPAHSYVITTRIAHCEQVVLNLLAQHHPVQRFSSSAFMTGGIHVTTRPLVLMTLTLRATRNIAWTGNILHLKLILSSIADVFGSIDYDLLTQITEGDLSRLR